MIEAHVFSLKEFGAFVLEEIFPADFFCYVVIFVFVFVEHQVRRKEAHERKRNSFPLRRRRSFRVRGDLSNVRWID